MLSQLCHRSLFAVTTSSWNPFLSFPLSVVMSIFITAVFNDSIQISKQSLCHITNNFHLVWTPIFISKLWKNGIKLSYYVRKKKEDRNILHVIKAYWYLHGYYKKWNNTAGFCWQMISNYNRTLCEAVVNIPWNKWMEPGHARVQQNGIPESFISIIFLIRNSRAISELWRN